MNPRKQWQATGILILAFLLLWVVHNNSLLKAVQQRLSDSQSEKLILLGEVILPEIEGLQEAVLEDPFVIYSLADEAGVARIVILDRDASVLVDSEGEYGAGEALTHLGIRPAEFSKVWEGDSRVSLPHREDSETSVRSIFLPLRDSNGQTLGIVRISMEVPLSVESSEGTATGFLLKLFGSMVGFVVVFTLFRSLKASRKKKSDPPDETETMIDAFHGMVRQLKEKEQEMEALKYQAEQRAEDVESYNENILQSVASGVITFDRNGRITTFNPAAEKVLGLNRQDVLEKSCEEVFGKGSPIEQMLAEVLEHEMVISRQEFELKRPLAKVPPVESPLDWVARERLRSLGERRQERIWLGVSTSLLRDRQRKVIGATFVFTDLTEIKHLQEQVELKRRLTVLGEMSAGIAHEFRNFMGTIMGFAKLISKRLEAQDSRQSMVEAIMREIGAMDRLIEQLLSFGRRAELNLVSVDLEAFLHKQILHVLTQVSEHARPKLKLAFPQGLPRVAIDDVLMRQALNNLLQNAVEAMPHGGELRVAVKALDQGILTGKDSGEVVIEIGDTGIGIPKDKLDKIFLPFFTTKEKGTGMGLALVHKIILSHNGRINAESVEGQGTTFRIHLPVKKGMVS